MDVVIGIVRIIGEEAGDAIVGLLFGLMALSAGGVFVFDYRQNVYVRARFALLSDPPPASEDEQNEEFESLGLIRKRSAALFLFGFRGDNRGDADLRFLIYEIHGFALSGAGRCCALCARHVVDSGMREAAGLFLCGRGCASRYWTCGAIHSVPTRANPSVAGVVEFDNRT
jgi:hypothetical protein